MQREQCSPVATKAVTAPVSMALLGAACGSQQTGISSRSHVGCGMELLQVLCQCQALMDPENLILNLEERVCLSGLGSIII